MTTSREEASICLVLEETIPAATVQPLVDALSSAGVPTWFERSKSDRIWASLEWYIPTAFCAYLVKGYLDGFLGEAGRDHYLAFKSGVRLLWSTFFGPARTVRRSIVASSPNKVDGRHSIAFSLVAQ